MSAAGDTELVARRLAAELSAFERVWVAPELERLRSLVPATLLAEDRIEVALVAASQLAETGDVRGPRAAPAADRCWAVIDTPMEIVRRCVAPVARVERAFGELGILEVTRAGLVIVELAAGVAATDLQRRSEATLKISSRVDLMRDNVPSHEKP